MATEKIDIYDESMSQIGVSTRSDALDNGYWQRSIHAWVLVDKTSDPKIVFQLRSPTKKVYPNKLDISAAGHLQAGESQQDGIREIEEELGICVQFNELIPMGTRTEVAKIGDKIVREFCDTYLLPLDYGIESFKPGEDEVSSVVVVPINDGLQLFSGRIERINVKGLSISSSGELVELERTITVADVIPRLDRFYYKVFLMAKLYCEGETCLAI